MPSVLLAAAMCAVVSSPSSLPPALSGVHRLLVLGDSITYSGGYVDVIDSFLRRTAPKSKVEIINIGLPSETVSGLTEPGHAGGAFPRPDLHERLARAIKKVHPDMVLACYGMNDGIYHPQDTARFNAYRKGITWLAKEVSFAGAKLWLATPPPFDPVPVKDSLWPAGKDVYPSGHTFEGYDGVLGAYSEWLVSKRDDGWNVIDFHGPLNAYLAEQRKTQATFTMAGDGVHLNETGHRIMAQEVLRAWGVEASMLPPIHPDLPGRDAFPEGEFDKLVHLRQRILTEAWLSDIAHKRPGMPQGLKLEDALKQATEIDHTLAVMNSSLPPLFPGTVSDYHGFNRHDFTVDGIDAIVVTPKSVAEAPTKPWIWRAEFFDHRPELDLALLAKGFHLVYINVGNTFGAPSAMKHWDAFYSVLTKTYGLSNRPVLEGLSRGGLYIYNWATKHPNCVSVLYGDNPVCDFKSWPGGKGKGPGSADDWKKLISDYGFKSEAEAMAYRGNPLDNLKPLAEAHVPIIHCAADADEAVPYEENTVVLKQRYESLGGEIKVIVKHGFKHHPHGLDDPTPLVDFITAHLKT